MRTLVATLAAAAVLVGVAAAVAAQEPTSAAETRTEIAGEAPAEPVDHGTTVEVPLEISYTYQEGSAGVSQGPTSIYVAARDAPGWLHPRVGTWILEAEVTPGGGETTLGTTLQVTVDDDAPSDTEGEVEVHAVAAENDGMKPSKGTTTVAIQTAETTDGNTTPTAATTGADSGSADDGSTIPAGNPLVAGLAAAGLAAARRRSLGSQG